LDLGGDGSTSWNASMSCRVLRDYFGQTHFSWSNVYYLNPSGSQVFQTFCDQQYYGGGWTLAVSVYGAWTASQVLSRGTVTLSSSVPGVPETDFSCLQYIGERKIRLSPPITRSPFSLWDYITQNEATSGNFAYRIHGGGLNGAGGIWNASRSYTTKATNNSLTGVTNYAIIGSWSISPSSSTTGVSLYNRMPWLPGAGNDALLTTATNADNYWWGTLISSNTDFDPAPYIESLDADPVSIFYLFIESAVTN